MCGAVKYRKILTSQTAPINKNTQSYPYALIMKRGRRCVQTDPINKSALDYLFVVEQTLLRITNMNKLFSSALVLVMLSAGVAYANPGAGPVGPTAPAGPSSTAPSTGTQGGVNNSSANTSGSGYSSAVAAFAPRPFADDQIFTEAQARARIAAFGYDDVTGLQQDAQSDWYGQATMNGQAVNIAMNARGDVVAQ
jgi:hypothetical protein